jgi:hypothetical protein
LTRQPYYGGDFEKTEDYIEGGENSGQSYVFCCKFALAGHHKLSLYMSFVKK